jgi:hypothetical protein
LRRFAMARSRFLVIAASVTLVIAAVSAGTVLAVTGPNDPAYAANLVFGKHTNEVKDDDVAGIANEGPDSSYAVEQYALRAYPADNIPTDATFAAQSTFKSFKNSGKSVGTWSPIGPLDRAVYPAVLDPFLFDGAPYVASGRVTALAIAPNCTATKCRLYMGAAGGGIWTTDKALDRSAKWTFTSGALGSNAIGSILLDPSDATNNTLYVATGELNASVDSEAGVGIFKTNNGGQTWALVPGSDIFFQRSIGQIALDNAGNLLVPIGSGVRGVSSDDGGAISSGSTTHPLATRGLYRQTGATFTLIRPIVAVATARGSTTVKLDPTHAGVLYVNEYSRGIWRSLDNGATWAQIKTPLNAGLSTDRAEFAVTTLPNGNTRMYVGVGNQSDAGANRARFYRTDDASGAAAFTDMTTAQNVGYCTAQCWYDNYVVTPAGSPDAVYLGGSYSYGQQHGPTNGRAVILSTDGGTSFTDMTLDGDPNHAEGMHPDQHALVTVPGNPFQFIAGSDGGVIRSDGTFADTSAKCDSRGLDATTTTFCKSMLRRVPTQLITMNAGLNTLQFQSLSVSAQHPNLVMGGTQDNGTFQYSGSTSVWPQIIYGDGGQSGFNALDDGLRFNTFSGQAHDANFRNGDPTKWVIISAPIISSPESSLFYPPIINDPNPAAAGSIFEGSFSVWRTQDWGGDRDYLEANCPEFTTPADQTGCGDFVRIGDGVTDLTSTAWGTRAGGAVSWIARDPSNAGTMWAATTGGRLFVTDNANAAASLVHWTRLDQLSANSIPRVITNIYADPSDPNRAWISYSGYDINTPGQPGHIFEINRTATTATWTDRSYNLDDFPATAVVRDDVTGDLYAGTDFAVFRLASGATSWTMTGGMPMVEVAGLTIVPGARLLYAATHGLGAWAMDLGKINK